MPMGLLSNLNEIVLRTGYELFIVDAEDMILPELIIEESIFVNIGVLYTKLRGYFLQQNPEILLAITES